MLFRKFILGLTLSAGLLLTSGSAMSQGLVEYLIIWTLVGAPDDRIDYEICGLNLGNGESKAIFEFRPSSPYAVLEPDPIVIAPGPGEIDCAIYKPVTAGALVQVFKVPAENASGDVIIGNTGRDVLIIGAGGAGIPGPTPEVVAEVWMRKDDERTAPLARLRAGNTYVNVHTVD